MGKIVKIKDLIKELQPRRKNQTVGFVTGRFDILHTGHINHLRFAKSKVDILIVGVDSDIAIKKTLSHSRPIHTQDDRAKVLSELLSVDYVLLLENKHSFNTKATNDYHKNINKLIKPNYLITSKHGDVYWELKKDRIESIGGELILADNEVSSISSQVINLIYN